MWKESLNNVPCAFAADIIHFIDLKNASCVEVFKKVEYEKKGRMRSTLSCSSWWMEKNSCRVGTGKDEVLSIFIGGDCEWNNKDWFSLHSSFPLKSSAFSRQKFIVLWLAAYWHRKRWLSWIKGKKELISIKASSSPSGNLFNLTSLRFALISFQGNAQFVLLEKA